MDKIKELTDFYMWMQENDCDHNIRSRVEKKAAMYLNGINVGQKLAIHNIGDCSEQWHVLSANMGDGKCSKCGKKLTELNYR